MANKRLLPTTTPHKVYMYSYALLKDLPTNALKMIENYLMFSKKAVNYPANSDRRSFDSKNDNDRTANNLEDRFGKFGLQTDDKYVYRVPVKHFCDLGKINFPTKIDMKIRLTLKTEMKKLFESKKKVTAIGAPDAQIIFNKAPFLQYEQILLTKNFRQYLETILLSSKVLRMEIQKAPFQKTYELQTGSQEFIVDFMRKAI